MKNFPFIVSIVTVVFCFGFYIKSFPPFPDTSNVDMAKPFTIPQVFQSDIPPELEAHNISYIKPNFPHFLGIYPFAEAIPIYPWELWITDEQYSFHEQDSFPYYDGGGLQIIIAPHIKLAEHIKQRLNNNSFFPVFLVNETKDIKALQGKDSYVFAIQEAKDSNGIWRPIEQRGFDFCGNGRWGMKIKPQEFALFLMPKYQGSYETELRVRFVNNKQVIFSSSYTGKINYQQFLFPKNSLRKDQFKENPWTVINWYFFGAIPLEFNQ